MPGMVEASENRREDLNNEKITYSAFEHSTWVAEYCVLWARLANNQQINVYFDSFDITQPPSALLGNEGTTFVPPDRRRWYPWGARRERGRQPA